MSIFQWSNRIKHKLRANANHFEIEEIEMIYIESRIQSNVAKHLNSRLRENFVSSFQTSEKMLDTLKKKFDDFNRKFIAINKFRALRMRYKDFHFFWAEFQRITFDLNEIDNALMAKIIHKLRLSIQRLISVEVSAKNIYELSKQYQHIYESDL